VRLKVEFENNNCKNRRNPMSSDSDKSLNDNVEGKE